MRTLCTRLAVKVFLLLALAVPGFAGQLDDYYLHAFSESPVGSDGVPEKSVPLPASEPVQAVRSGTPLRHALKKDWSSLESTTRKTLAKYLALPVLSGTEQVQLSSGGHFRIHYTTSGTDAPNINLINQYTGLGLTSVGNWITRVADSFEYAYSYYHGSAGAGYQPPPNFPGTPYDVYVQSLASQGAYGFTQSGQALALPGYPYAFTSYIEIDKDFTNSIFTPGVYDPLQSLQVTSAHEFHHAVQYGYNYYFDIWYAEATSTWFENELYPAVKELYAYLPGWLTNSTSQLDLSQANFNFNSQAYGRWLLNRYLAEAHGASVVRSIWERTAAMAPPADLSDIPMVPVLDSVLSTSYNSTLGADFFGMSKRIYLHDWTTHTADSGRIVYSPVRTFSSYPVSANTAGSSVTLPHYSFAYYKFVPSASAPALTISLTKAGGIKTAVFKQVNGTITEVAADSGGGSFTVNGFNTMNPQSDEVTLLIANSSNLDAQQASFSAVGGTSGPSPLPTISGIPVATATLGAAYSFTPSATGATSFSITGVIPAGLSFDTSTGTLSGTPTSAGAYSNLVISAVNSAGSASLLPFTLIVNAKRITLVLSAAVPSGQLAGVQVTITLPHGVTVQADPTGPIYSPTLTLSGQWADTHALVGGRYIPATLTAPGTVIIASVDPAISHGSGEFARVNCDVTDNTTPDASAFAISTTEAVDAQGDKIADVVFSANILLPQTIGAISFAPNSLFITGITTVSAAASSGLDVTFSSATPDVCSVNGTTVTALTSGTCIVAADQVGDGTYDGAVQVTGNITSTKLEQSIGIVGFSPVTVKVGSTTTVSAAATSGLPVSFSSSTPDVCKVNGTTVSALSAGVCTLTANQPGNASYNQANQMTADVTSVATVPGAPTDITALPGNGRATVTFTAPGFNGGSAVTGYTVTSSPGNLTATGPSSPLIVTGLTAGTSYTFTVRAINAQGSSVESAVSNGVFPNLLPPIIGAPSSFLVKSGAAVTYTITYTGADNITLTAGNLTLNKSGNANATAAVSGSGATTRTVTISGISGDGTLGISIGAGTANALGGTVTASASSASTSFVVDNTAPTLTVDTLANATTTSNNTLTVTGRTSDANAVQATTVNGTAVTLSGDAFNTAVALIDGANTVTVVATDAAGNATTDIRTITYDHSTPVIAFTSATPADQGFTNMGTATIAGTVDKPGLVEITINAASPITVGTGGAQNSFTAAVLLAPGVNTISIKASDTAIPPNVSTVQRTVSYDSSAPALSITDPSAAITTTFDSHLVKGMMTDNFNGCALSATLDGVTLSPAPTVGPDGAFQIAVPFTENKTYHLVVTATDQAGNITTVQRNIVYSPVELGDALRALQISVGLETYDLAKGDDKLDVGPLRDGKPHPDGTIDVSDALLLLRKVVGLISW
jgi:hypothetical protein